MIINEDNYKNIFYPVFNGDKIIFYIPENDEFAIIEHNMIEYQNKHSIFSTEVNYPKTIEDVNNVLALIEFLINKLKMYHDEHEVFFNLLLKIKKNIKNAEEKIIKEIL